MIKLEGTSVRAGDSELRKLYINECRRQGVDMKHEAGAFKFKDTDLYVRENVLHHSPCVGLVVGREITIDILRAQLESAESITNSEEWEDYPPVGINVMVDYCDDDGSDIWVGFHGPSKVIAYSGDHVWIAHHGVHNRIHNLCDVEFKRVETPEELAAKARESFSSDVSNIEAELILQVFNDTSRDTLGERLYDMGYRKTEGDK